MFGIPPPVREQVLMDMDHHDLSDHPMHRPSTPRKAASRFKDTSAPRPNPPNQSIALDLTVPQRPTPQYPIPQHPIPQPPIPQYPIPQRSVPQPPIPQCPPAVPATLPATAACKTWEAFRLAAPISTTGRPTPRPYLTIWNSNLQSTSTNQVIQPALSTPTQATQSTTAPAAKSPMSRWNALIKERIAIQMAQSTIAPAATRPLSRWRPVPKKRTAIPTSPPRQSAQPTPQQSSPKRLSAQGGYMQTRI